MGLKDEFKRAGNNFKVPLSAIILAPNVRTTIVQETIAELANSLILEGQRDHIKGYLHDDGKHFVVTSGQRRYRAALYANEHLSGSIDSLVADVEAKVDGKNPTGPELKFRQLTDGLTQERLCPEDQAKAIKSLIEEDGLKISEIAKRMRCSDQHIRDLLKFLEAPEKVKDAVRKGAISHTTAVRVAKADEDTKKEVEEKIDAGEKVRGVDVGKEDSIPTTLTTEEINAQIKKIDARFYKETTEKGRAYYKGMSDMAMIILGHKEKL